MGDKPYKLVIKVDLCCCRCRKAIQDYLCKLQRKECLQIVSIDYDLKKDVVVVSCPSNPEELKRKLLCKLCKIIKDIEIIKPPVPDENWKVFKDKCEEKYKEIKEREAKCKKECEEKCRKECEDPFKQNQPPKCKCNRKCECPTQPPKPPPSQTQLNQLIQIKINCCARPCPCWIAWSNCYRCCSCGVESWPGRSGSGCSSGPSYGGTRQWSNCEQFVSNKIFLESEPTCRIM